MDEQVAHFVGITGASPDTARQLLEQHGDIMTAVDSFYNQDTPATTSAPEEKPDMVGGAAAGPWPGSESSKSNAQPRRTAPRRGGIMTFADLRGSDDAERDDPVNLFAGGERSGINVENPQNREPNSLVSDILRQAAQAPQEQAEPAPKSQAFSGVGRSLTDTTPEEQPQATRGSLLDQFANFLHGNRPAQAPAEPEETVQRHLTFWQNGFSLGDGPLMHYDNPEHAEILRTIQSGHAPLGLLNVRPGQAVEMVVARRTNEQYQPPPPPPAQPFSGEGQRLGSAAPVVTGSGSDNAAPSTSTPMEAPPAPDLTQPMTQVQVRLPDGSRLVVKLNQHNTINVLRAHISYARPELAQQAYVIQGGFPPRPVSDEAQTVADAGLLNSVVVIK